MRQVVYIREDEHCRGTPQPARVCQFRTNEGEAIANIREAIEGYVKTPGGPPSHPTERFDVVLAV